MIALAGYDFANNKACLICRHAMNDEEVTAFLHDSDGDLQFSCGRNDHHQADWLLVDIEDVISRHPYVCLLPIVRMGEMAEKKFDKDIWVVSVGSI